MGDDRCDLLCLDLPRAEAVRGSRLPDAELAAAAARARGLAEPLRVELALALRQAGELCVCDLAWIVSRSQSLVSHHLRVLRSAGLVASRRDGKLVLYSLTAAGDALVGDLLAVRTALA